MARPSNTMRYPSYFWDILDRLKADQTNTVELVFDTATQRRSVQLDFIAFRQACLKEQRHISRTIKGGTAEVPDDFTVPAEYPDLNAYTTRMTETPKTYLPQSRKDVLLGERTVESYNFILRFYHCDHTPEAIAAKRSLGVDS